MNEKENIFGSLLFIAQRWTVNGDRILMERTGITVKQWMLLVILSIQFKDYAPTLSEAAAEFGTSRQNLKQVLRSLEKKALVNIVNDESDSRAQRIVLTGKHLQSFEGEENEAWQKQYIASLFKGFDEHELQQLQQLMLKLRSNLPA